MERKRDIKTTNTTPPKVDYRTCCPTKVPHFIEMGSIVLLLFPLGHCTTTVQTAGTRKAWRDCESHGDDMNAVHVQRLCCVIKARPHQTAWLLEKPPLEKTRRFGCGGEAEEKSQKRRRAEEERHEEEKEERHEEENEEERHEEEKEEERHKEEKEEER